ncbi:hypothetical protein AAC387_Pa09g0485 [Persea americana]
MILVHSFKNSLSHSLKRDLPHKEASVVEFKFKLIEASSVMDHKGCENKEIGNCITIRGDRGGLLMEDGRSQCFLGGKGLDYLRMVIAEMVGTFIMMYCIYGIVAITELSKGQVGLLEYAATAGFAIIMVIFTVGPISGAHVNPSITIAFAASGQFPWSMVPFYIVAQTLGSVIAVGVGMCVYSMEPSFAVTRPLRGRSAAFWSELIATFFIMFLASNLSNHAREVGLLSGFAVAASISLAVLLTGPMSGASLNPARSFAPALVSWKFDDLWLYIVGPTIGALGGVLLCRLLQPNHQYSSSTSSPNRKFTSPDKRSMDTPDSA